MAESRNAHTPTKAIDKLRRLFLRFLCSVFLISESSSSSETTRFSSVVDYQTFRRGALGLLQRDLAVLLVVLHAVAVDPDQLVEYAISVLVMLNDDGLDFDSTTITAHSIIVYNSRSLIDGSRIVIQICRLTRRNDLLPRRERIIDGVDVIPQLDS